MEQNNLFQCVDIVVAPNNRGIVQNFLTALKCIKTDRYKVLAGDDLYFNNNVYEAMMAGDYVVTPAIKLRDSALLKDIPWKFKWILKQKENLRGVLYRDMKYGQPVETPGVFWDHSFCSADLYEVLSKHKWIEDVPCFSYLFGIDNLKVSILRKPYIIYRVGSGISTNTNHFRSKEFLEEESAIKKEYCFLQYKYPRLSVLFFRIRRRLYTNVLNFVDAELRKFDVDFQSQVENAADFYEEIHCRAEEWVKNYS